jgi:hypothetical protein
MNPFMSLMIYNASYANIDSNFYIEYALMKRVSKDDEEPLYKPSVYYPLTNTKVLQLRNILNSIKTANTENKFIKHIFNRHMISFDESNIVWIVSKKQRVLIDKDGLTYKVMFPNCIFKFKNNKLSIIAFNKFNGLNTELYYVHLPNISTTSVCLGNNEITNYNTYEELMTRVEDVFFNSPFTNTIDTNGLILRGIFNDNNKAKENLKQWI